MSISRLADAVLGRDPRRRGWARMCLTSTATYVAYGGITALQIHFGNVDPVVGVCGFVATMLCSALFYAAIRSGWSQRFAADPSLGVTQLLVGIGFFWFAYATSGPGSATTPVIVVSHIVYAMFGLPARQVYRLTALSLGGLAAVMVACHALAPERYPVAQQLLALSYTTLVVLLVTRLAGQLTSLHERLRAQRNQLEAALQQVKALAVRDELTQLPNRRNMHELLQKVSDRSAQASVAMIDIDHFKRINDQHGHAMGDEVLRRFAEVGASALRGSDHLARWGGEEFLLLMPDTDPAAARAALQRLRGLVAQAPMGPAQAPLHVTFSAGLAQLAPGESVEQCIARADRAMYRAKQSGRDRVEFNLDEAVPA